MHYMGYLEENPYILWRNLFSFLLHLNKIFVDFVAPISLIRDLNLCTFCNFEFITSFSELLKWILFTHSENRRKMNLALSSSICCIMLLQYSIMKKLIFLLFI